MSNEEIVNKYGGLVMSLAVQFRRQWNYIPWEVSDLFQEGILNLLSKKDSYKEKESLFSTFTYNITKYHLLTITKKDRIGDFQQTNEDEELFDTTCHFKFGNLSEQAALYLKVVLEMPEGLVSLFTSKRGSVPFKYTVGNYLNMNRKEVLKIKEELLDNFLV